MMVMATPRGRDCRVTLSDGTRVWLNGESELRFPFGFTSGRREVHLRGEAFFEVAKDPQRPFVVTSDYYSATVLGTSFDAPCLFIGRCERDPCRGQRAGQSSRKRVGSRSRAGLHGHVRCRKHDEHAPKWMSIPAFSARKDTSISTRLPCST